MPHIEIHASADAIANATTLPDLESTADMGAASAASAGASTILPAGMLPVYAKLESVQAACPKDGKHVIVHAKKNASRGSDAADGWQVFTVVESFASGLDSLGSWADLVNSVLVQQASDTLKNWRSGNPDSTMVPAHLFTQSALRESYMMDGSGAITFTREQLDSEFSKSATWARIVGSAMYKQNPQYRSIASVFKEKILALAGRSHGSITDEDLDKILAKLEESDLESSLGAYVVRRIQKIKKDREADSAQGFSIDDL